MNAHDRLALVILAVEDLPRALAFYRQAFDWEQAVDVPVYAEFRIPGGMRFGINAGQEPQAIVPGGVTATELYFYPRDLGVTMRRVEAAGARRLKPLARKDWGDEAAYYADPDGNVVVLARPLRAP